MGTRGEGGGQACSGCLPDDGVACHMPWVGQAAPAVGGLQGLLYQFLSEFKVWILRGAPQRWARGLLGRGSRGLMSLFCMGPGG